MVNKRPPVNGIYSTVDCKRYQHFLAILHSGMLIIWPIANF